MRENNLQWHAGFQAVLQIELSEEKEKFHFFQEYNLSQKPLQIDTLVVRGKITQADTAVSSESAEEQEKNVGKNLGRLFRKYNIIEYKSPDDYLSINDFYKVMGYACLYQSETEHVLAIRPEELTVTLVCSRYPRKLMYHLKHRYHTKVTRPFPGIYYIEDLMFPVQLVIPKELSKEEYKWLSRLKKGLDHEDIETLAKEYKGREKDPLYEAAMDLIVRANRHVCEEEWVMCQALRELFQDEFERYEEMGRRKGVEQGLEQGREQGLEKGIEQGVKALVCSDVEAGVDRAFTITKLKKYFSMSQEEAEKAMEKALASV